MQTIGRTRFFFIAAVVLLAWHVAAAASASDPAAGYNYLSLASSKAARPRSR